MKKRALSTLLALLLAVSLLPLAALAGGGTTHTVSAGTLTVRQEPDSESPRIGGLTQGKEVVVVEDQGDWSKIEYGSGYGWVMTKYLTPIPDPEDMSPTHYVNTGVVAVRELAGGESAWLGNLTLGDQVKVTAAYDGWSQIIYDGGPGWVASVCLTPLGSGEPPALYPEDFSNPFEDVKEGNYFYDGVLWAYYRTPQVTKGVSDTKFGPYATVTRAQTVTFLWRACGEPAPSATANPFVDVKTTDYYYKAVLWAVEKGITVGADATHFSPGQTCSTAHIITFLYRAMEEGPDGWYEEAGAWAMGHNLLADTNLTVSPKVGCPRGAVVTFLFRALGP